MGGLLADPATTLPGLFGPNAAFGMQWLQKYPYALPGVLNAVFLTVTAAFVFFGLEEVRPSPPPSPTHLTPPRPSNPAKGNSTSDYTSETKP
jgi:hypothetical protein